jgi:hypothetical protein
VIAEVASHDAFTPRRSTVSGSSVAPPTELRPARSSDVTRRQRPFPSRCRLFALAIGLSLDLEHHHPQHRHQDRTHNADHMPHHQLTSASKTAFTSTMDTGNRDLLLPPSPPSNPPIPNLQQPPQPGERTVGVQSWPLLICPSGPRSSAARPGNGRNVRSNALTRTPVRGITNPGCDAEIFWMVSLLRSLRSRLARLLGPPEQLRDGQGSGSLGLGQFSALTRP